MMRIHNVGNLDASEISSLCEYLSKSPDEALVTNRRKNQYVFKTISEGKPLIVKQYLHLNLHHRLASLIGQSNADRYCSLAHFLRDLGVPVPKPLSIVRTGRGLLPEQTLYAMEHVEGSMLSTILLELETNSARMKLLAEKVARLILCLRQAGVVHRDLNTKNFLVSPLDEMTLIDFDHASRHRPQSSRFMRRHQKDIQNFLSTCHGAPRFAAEVASHLLNP